MKEIKFRGKTKVNGEFVYGFYWSDPEGYYIRKMNDDGIIQDYEIIGATASQYTGCKDDNGEDIYEDIF